MSEKNNQKTNSVTLIGNLGAEAEDQAGNDTGQIFTTASLYTRKSYRDDQGEWQELPSILHDIVAFKPWVMADLKSFKTGARLKITGELNYRVLDVILEGKAVKIKQASIIALKVEQASLYKKNNETQPVVQPQASIEQEVPTMA